jgi:hypothetical protein
MNEVIAWVTFAGPGCWSPGRCIRVRSSSTNSISTAREIEGIKALVRKQVALLVSVLAVVNLDTES